MRRRLIVLTLVAALAGCSGDDEKDPGAVATAPAQTVTETVERDAPAAKAEKKEGAEEKRISEASPKPKRMSLGEYLLQGPSLEGVDLERDRSPGREVDLE